ncbi:hypothetical protein P7K49_028592 [Saguinus oedipus]|uniref:Uncharacterized protein n=1 Tax=Saguinus oedipus TaxID=9490 RepID=A0ABQ9U5K2_SAGOE|nr:hypothetical protein P7K49_028592 [Saguinus oedipus]
MAEPNLTLNLGLTSQPVLVHSQFLMTWAMGIHRKDSWLPAGRNCLSHREPGCCSACQSVGAVSRGSCRLSPRMLHACLQNVAWFAGLSAVRNTQQEFRCLSVHRCACNKNMPAHACTHSGAPHPPHATSVDLTHVLVALLTCTSSDDTMLTRKPGAAVPVLCECWPPTVLTKEGMSCSWSSQGCVGKAGGVNQEIFEEGRCGGGTVPWRGFPTEGAV